MDTRMPAEVFPPGEYLADELETRGWSQADFAEIISRPVQFVSEIINGKKEITAESATQIAAALGTSAESWLSLQARFRLWELAQDAQHAFGASRVTARARVAVIIPLATLEKRGVIGRSEDPGALLAEVMRDFNMLRPEDTPHFRLAAKRSNREDDLSLTQRGWLWAAQREAQKRELPPYDAAALRRLAATLAREVTEPDDLSGVPERFAAVGVHVLFVEHVPGGKIDGAAFMLGTRPVIAVSGRGKRFDKLFFALMHEVAHVLKGHAAKGVAIDDAEDRDGETPDPWEEEANDLAEELMFGGAVRIEGTLSARAVTAKADELGVPVAFVIGNLQHHQALDWRTTLAKGLPNADDVLRSWASDNENRR